jgi:Uncharacterized protein conserved in bacteria (DUF2252)
MKCWVLSLMVFSSLACAGGQPPPPAQESSGGLSLYVSPHEEELTLHRELIDRIAESPQGYFRYINEVFTRRVCAELDPEELELPSVVLHGDAHVEQFAITDAGYGLDDFDAAGEGPAVVDLVRFSTSIALACRSRAWGADERQLIEAFLDRYVFALRESKAREPEPLFVAQQIEGFPADRQDFLDFVEKVIEPVPGDERKEARVAFSRFVESVTDLATPPGFFEVHSFGRFSLGVGSALDRKYLWRVQGPTSALGDDVVLEMHEVRDLPEDACVSGNGEHPANRILRSARSLGRIEDRWRGAVPAASEDTTPFWIHTWRAHFYEVHVADEELGLSDLRAIVLVAAEQLGSGHVGMHGSRLQSQKVAAAVEPLRGRIRDLSVRLAGEVEGAWRRFRLELGRG